jgi:hypothetical protein
VALTFARGLVAAHGAEWLPETRTVFVPGSWLPLALIVALFALKYGAGVSLALHPGLAIDTAFAGLCSLAYGFFSGLFLARGWSLRTLAARRPIMQVA